MNIQLNVLIWTIICFCLAMLILDRLLFRPLLKFMDARQAKIDAAKAQREALASRRQKTQALPDPSLMDARKAAMQAAQARQAEAEAEAALAVNQAKEGYASRLEAQRAAQRLASADICADLESQLDTLAVSFAQKLVS